MTGNPTLPLFYREVVALSRTRHRDWFIDPDQGFSFAARTNSVYVAASEFAAAAREYAIVFTRDGQGSVVPAALLGLQGEQNLMVGQGGRWEAKYIPAYVRRYPFILATASASSEQFTVCIDEAYSGFNTAREGERLIGDDGGHGELLGKSVSFLQEFHKHTAITARFCAALDELQLLDTMQAEVAMNSGERFALAGLLAVTRPRLAGLSAAQLKELFDQGYLDLIYRHMHSLANLDSLLERVQKHAECG